MKEAVLHTQTRKGVFPPSVYAQGTQAQSLGMPRSDEQDECWQDLGSGQRMEKQLTHIYKDT